MSTPTFRQAQQTLKLITDLNLPIESVQRLLEAGDLIGMLAIHPDLGKVDRTAFAAALAPRLTIPWTPVDQYVEKIMARSVLCGWGFRLADATKLAAELHAHHGSLTPTSVSIDLRISHRVKRQTPLGAVA